MNFITIQNKITQIINNFLTISGKFISKELATYLLTTNKG